MIRNLWYAVLESKEIPRAKPVGYKRLGERLLFWRDAEGKAHCFFDRCAHRGASLALGDIVDGRARCPFHGLEYDASGRCVRIPANGRDAPVPAAFRMRSYPVFEGWGWVFIWWGEGAPDPAEPPYFEDLKDCAYWASAQDPWDNHYTRVAENQLDVAHLPFVHHNTIGRGNRTLVEGPGVEWVVGKLGSLMNLVIAHQDRRIVNTQLPKSDGVGTGENLFRGDKPIMEFRKKRQELRKRQAT